MPTTTGLEGGAANDHHVEGMGQERGLNDGQRGSNGLTLVHSGEPSSTRPPPGRPAPVVAFDRVELGLIMGVYGKKVAKGEWRDYALDFLKERAVFSAFARNSERPLFTVEKTPKLRGKQGQYSVVNQQGRILKRGNDLRLILNILEPHYSVVD